MAYQNNTRPSNYRILPPRLNRAKQSFVARSLLTMKSTFSFDLLSGLKSALGAFFAPKVTVQYPLESIPLSPRYRAIHKLQRLLESDQERCIGCGLCEKICTSNCIRIITDRGEDGRKKILNYSINFGRCIYCGLCAEVCPELAIVHGEHIENASVQRAQFGFKPELLEAKSSLMEFGGFGSISSNAHALKATPLSYTKSVLDSETSESSSESSPESSLQANAAAALDSDTNAQASAQKEG